TTDWPQTSCNRLPTRRAVVSVEPPGVKGTTIRTGLAGQSAPAESAREEMIDGAARLVAARATKRRGVGKGSSHRMWRPIIPGRCCEECGGDAQQNQCGERRAS